MRTQVTRAGLLGLMLAGMSLGQVGCDSYTTGHDSDPGGPVRLMRVMVEDSPPTVVDAVNNGNTTRMGCTDLLDDDAPVHCDDTHPCKVLLALEGGIADFTCRNSVCNDALKTPATGVPINPDTPPVVDDMTGMETTPAVPGTSIRLVFDRLLDPSSITTDGSTLKEGVIDFVDNATGTTFDAASLGGLWDPAGATNFTSDPLLLPYGPAIQISPFQPSVNGTDPTGLTHNTSYTIIIHPGLIKDRHGHPLGDKHGKPITGDLAVDFTTENVAANASVGSFVAVSGYQLPGDFTPIYGKPVQMYNVDVLQLAFAVGISLDFASFAYTLTGPDGNAVDKSLIEVFPDAPIDSANMCETPGDNQVNLAFTTGTKGMGAPWPNGVYKLHFSVDAANANTSTFDSSMWPGADGDGNLTFEVIDAPSDESADTDPANADNHPLPENQTACPEGT